MAGGAVGQARAQADLLGRGDPVLPEHQVLVRAGVASDAGAGGEPAAAGGAGLAGAGLQHGVPTSEDAADPDHLPSQRRAPAAAGRQHGGQVRRRG